MLTANQISTLLIVAQSQSVLIIMPDAVSAHMLRQEIHADVKLRYPDFVSLHSNSGATLNFNAHEPIMVTVAMAWNAVRRFPFGGKVYVWDGMQSDEYSPIMYINTSPEPLIASLEGIKKWNLSNRE